MLKLALFFSVALLASGCATRQSTPAMDSASVPVERTPVTEMERVKLLYETGKLDDAEVLALAVLEKEPDHKAAQYYLGLIWDSKARRSAVPEGTGFWYPTLPMRPAK